MHALSSSKVPSITCRISAVSIGVSVRASTPPPGFPPSICTTQASALSRPNCTTQGSSRPAVEPATMAVVVGRVSAYSWYDTSSSPSGTRWVRRRTLAVSCEAHWRANVSNAASSWRVCSRPSCAGRLKSYAG